MLNDYLVGAGLGRAFGKGGGPEWSDKPAEQQENRQKFLLAVREDGDREWRDAEEAVRATRDGGRLRTKPSERWSDDGRLRTKLSEGRINNGSLMRKRQKETTAGRGGSRLDIGETAPGRAGSWQRARERHRESEEEAVKARERHRHAGKEELQALEAARKGKKSIGWTILDFLWSKSG